MVKVESCGVSVVERVRFEVKRFFDSSVVGIKGVESQRYGEEAEVIEAELRLGFSSSLSAERQGRLRS